MGGRGAGGAPRGMSDEPGATALLDRFHAAFAAGDVGRCTTLFADDAKLCLLYREALDGRDAIRAWFEESFERVDTSAWEPRTELLEVHDDAAYAYGTYTERLRTRADDSRQLVRGRLVFFLRRSPEGWRIRLLMNSHSHRMEPIT
jgi:ketosteroid isomerase-like protein